MPAVSADLTNLAKALSAASKNSTPAISAVMNSIANEMKDNMVQMAPKRTGRLAGSISVLRSGNTWTIGPKGVNYAVYQEFGTASRGEFGGLPYKIRPRQEGGTLSFKIDGEWISTKEVTHPGIPAHPYVRPAAQAVLQSLQKKVGVAVQGLIVVKGPKAS